MSDLIERQVAIDAIIEDKICDDSLKMMTALGDGDKAETLNMTCDRHAKMLMSLPSAQPKIIRCEGCKYYNDNTEECDNDQGLRFLDYSNLDQMYCPWAERREE